MKKFVSGLFCGIILMLSVGYASGIEVTISPAKMVINRHEWSLGDEYVLLNYKGHVYAPVRFIAQNLATTVDYDSSEETIQINNISGSTLNIIDPDEKYVHLGHLQLRNDGDDTIVTGYIEIMLPDWNLLGANLSFYDDKGASLGFVVISDNIPPGISRFELRGKGDFTNYTITKLHVGYLNGVKGRVPENRNP